MRPGDQRGGGANIPARAPPPQAQTARAQLQAPPPQVYEPRGGESEFFFGGGADEGAPLPRQQQQQQPKRDVKQSLTMRVKMVPPTGGKDDRIVTLHGCPQGISGMELLRRMNGKNFEVPPALHFGTVVRFWVEIDSGSTSSPKGLWRSKDYNVQELFRSMFVCQPSTHRARGLVMRVRDSDHPYPNLSNVWVAGMTCMQGWSTCKTPLHVRVGPLLADGSGVSAVGSHVIPVREAAGDAGSGRWTRESDSCNLYLDATRGKIKNFASPQLPDGWPMLPVHLLRPQAGANGLDISPGEIRAGVTSRVGLPFTLKPQQRVETWDSKGASFTLPTYFTPTHQHHASATGGGGGDTNGFAAFKTGTGNGGDSRPSSFETGDLLTYCGDMGKLVTVFRRYVEHRARRKLFDDGVRPLNPEPHGVVQWAHPPDSEYVHLWSNGECPGETAEERCGVRIPSVSEMDLLGRALYEVDKRHALHVELTAHFLKTRPNEKPNDIDQYVVVYPVLDFEHVVFEVLKRQTESGSDKRIRSLFELGFHAVPAFAPSSTTTAAANPLVLSSHSGTSLGRAGGNTTEGGGSNWQCGLLVQLVYLPRDTDPHGEAAVTQGSVVPDYPPP